jgi:hypothetical protein
MIITGYGTNRAVHQNKANILGRLLFSTLILIPTIKLITSTMLRYMRTSMALKITMTMITKGRKDMAKAQRNITNTMAIMMGGGMMDEMTCGETGSSVFQRAARN